MSSTEAEKFMNLFEHEIFGVESPRDAECWVYHYTSMQKALAIASSQELWLGPMATMNDPREFKVIEPVTVRIMRTGGAVDPTDTKRAIESLVERRLDVRVASFTADAASGEPKTATRASGRGYARPSLWAHYADGHHRVCLVFDRSALIQQLEVTFGANAIHALVTYVGGTIQVTGAYPRPR